MANRYWVGGSGNWNTSSTTNWSATSGGAGGASIPTSSDNVIFDSNSSASTYTVTVANPMNAVLNVTFGAPASGTLNVSGNWVVVYGNATTAASGVNITSELWLFANSTSTTLTTNGNTLNCNVKIKSTNTVSLTDNLTCNNLYVDNGSFSQNGKTITATAFYSTSPSVVRNITLDSTLNLSIFIASNSGSALTMNASSSVFNMSGRQYNAGTMVNLFQGAGKTYGTLNLADVGPTVIGDGNTFTNVTNSVAPSTIWFVGGATYNFTNFSLSGTSGNLITIARGSGATPYVLNKTSGAVSVAYCNISNSTAQGGASWVAPLTSGNVDGGGNSGWLFTTASGSSGNFMGFF